MQRFYVPAEQISIDSIKLCDKGQIHHLKDVLRLEAGSRVVIFDGRQREYLCRVKEISAGQIILEILQRFTGKPQKLLLAVACALPKKSRMDEIIDKLTQLGAREIIPLVTKRVIVKLDKQKEAARLARWRKIAQSAAQQSGRPDIPQITPIKNMAEALRETQDYDLKLIPTLEGRRYPLKEILARNQPRKILFFIGPEGDFTVDEVGLAKKSGCVPVSLGELVLRVETAAVCAASFIKLYYEDN